MAEMVAGTRGRLEGFLHWWADELTALIPTSVRRAMTHARRELIVDDDGVAVTLTAIRGEERRSLGVVDLSAGDPASHRTALQRCVQGMRLGEWPVVLRLRDDRILRDEIRLPAAAQENLRDAVGFQLDRLTPFKPAEVHFDCRPLGQDARNGAVRIALVIAPRAVVDEAVARLAGLGLRPQSITLADDTGDAATRFNLLTPADSGADRRRKSSSLSRSLGIAAAILAVALLYLSLDHDRRVAQALDAEVQTARGAARTAEAISRQIAEAKRQARFIVDRKRAVPSVTRLLNDLSQLLPDDTWLSDFEFRDGTATISGRSSETSTVISRIERSPSFEGVHLTGPIRRDPATGSEMFQLTFATARTKDRPR